MNIDQLVQELERQKSSIEGAIAALNGVAGLGTTPEFRKTISRSPRTVVSGTEPIGTDRKRARKRSRRIYSDDFRRNEVAAVREGMSFGQAAKKFRTTWFTVREWVNSGRFEAPKQNAVRKKRATGKKQSVLKKAGVKTLTKRASSSGKTAKTSARKKTTEESETQPTV